MFDIINDAVISNPNPVPIATDKLLEAVGEGIIGEFVNCNLDTLADQQRQLTKRLPSGRNKFDGVAHP